MWQLEKAEDWFLPQMHPPEECNHADT
jgi:hypothetical protein